MAKKTHSLNSSPTVRVIAEIGCNHRGEFETALRMIERAASFCNVDAVKFQKRTPKELLTTEEYKAPHPVPRNSYGETYGKHREVLELPIEQHQKLKTHCEEHGVTYSTSVWDMTSAREVISIDPDFIKVPSACNVHFNLLELLAEAFSGIIHLSLGMTTREEEEQIVDFFVRKRRSQDLVLYSCTSGYPVPFEDICLREITRLKKNYGSTVKDIGFSGHHKGIAADIAALAFGARWVERHFTLDRTWKGTDHAASLEPDGLRRLARDLRNVEKALTYKETPILPIEEPQRVKLKRQADTIPVETE